MQSKERQAITEYPTYTMPEDFSFSVVMQIIPGFSVQSSVKTPFYHFCEKSKHTHLFWHGYKLLFT